MAETKRIGAFEISQDLRYMHHQWTAQRWGWLAMVTLLVLALVGLVGDGPISRTSAASSDGTVQVDYERFLHRHGPTDLRIRVAPEATRAGKVQLWIDQEFLSRVQIERITPEPEVEESGSDQHLLVFAVAKPGEPSIICIQFEPLTAGPLEARIGLKDKQGLSLSQFAYP